MTGYSFTTPVWDGGTWVTPVVAEVVAARRANGPEDQPRKQDAPAEWDKIDWRAHEGQVRRLLRIPTNPITRSEVFGHRGSEAA